MKFTLTSITEEGVRVLSDNPIGKTPRDGWWLNDGRHGTFEEYKARWQEAEANRKEYKVSEFCLSQSVNFKSFWLFDEHDLLATEGMRIEGDINENNQIVNIKLC